MFSYMPHYVYYSTIFQPKNWCLVQVKVKTIVMVAKQQRRSILVIPVVRKKDS